MCQTQVISKHIGRIGRRSFDRRMRIVSPLYVEAPKDEGLQAAMAKVGEIDFSYLFK